MAILNDLTYNELPVSELQVTLENLESRLMKDILEKLMMLSGCRSNVVLSGEPGTGKEWFAKLLCHLVRDSYGYMACMSCDQLKADDLDEGFNSEIEREIAIRSEGKGVIIIINNFSEMEPMGQLKLLSKMVSLRDRIDKENCRFIFIVQKDWMTGEAQHTIWPYICELLSPVSILLPPLREHREDILPLINLFIQQHLESVNDEITGDQITISDQALYRCLNYDWPGNLRQLRNAVTHACFSKKGASIEPEDFPISIDVSHLFANPNLGKRSWSFQNAEKLFINRKKQHSIGSVKLKLHKIIGYLTK